MRHDTVRFEAITAVFLEVQLFQSCATVSRTKHFQRRRHWDPSKRRYYWPTETTSHL